MIAFLLTLIYFHCANFSTFSSEYIRAISFVNHLVGVDGQRRRYIYNKRNGLFIIVHQALLSPNVWAELTPDEQTK
jgi:hypothetical protein